LFLETIELETPPGFRQMSARKKAGCSGRFRKIFS